jgi:hypothetical protein
MNRLAAFKIIGTEPTFVIYHGDDIVGSVAAVNINRPTSRKFCACRDQLLVTTRHDAGHPVRFIAFLCEGAPIKVYSIVIARPRKST